MDKCLGWVFDLRQPLASFPNSPDAVSQAAKSKLSHILLEIVPSYKNGRIRDVLLPSTRDDAFHVLRQMDLYEWMRKFPRLPQPYSLSACPSLDTFDCIWLWLDDPDDFLDVETWLKKSISRGPKCWRFISPKKIRDDLHFEFADPSGRGGFVFFNHWLQGLTKRKIPILSHLEFKWRPHWLIRTAPI